MSYAQNPSREPRWAGEFLGLPESGPASAASYPRRIGAIFIDWFVASGIAMIIEPGNSWWVLVVFIGMHFALLWLFGTTLGKRVFKIQVVQVGGATIKLYQAAIRAVLLGLVIPVLVIDRDGRGLHDKLAGTVQIHM
ncbi:RDD family protein [Enteractinococcus fodinae]|uniref:RDD family membrane protein YckC n=1 Tax=Enteractinococcus fodinae TaxID=684663 RepID=A0ABU2B108_9MICC|nr:RDD family protein [Enteractinococcus fodinae]MDR7347293.1 putative RDD family membrane protein YckC [Enteractinococcus fodinae]